MENYDVLIIGGGLAAYYSALSCRKRGLKVALIEKALLGGTGIRTGALPVKKLLDSFKGREKDRESIKLDLIKNWNKDIKSLENKIENDLLTSGVDLYFGDGEFLDEHRYSVGDNILYGKYIIIATGTEPSSIGEIEIDNE
ncbi:FAD-dependent oxidoreductase, partial [Anaerosalibacter bizertensis]|nr:FAD-dependent oxidoreductase [Anaerosalibacter bizertensis]